MREQTLKATIAACVLGAAVVAVWAFARLRDGGRPESPVETAAPGEPRRSVTPASARAPARAGATRRPVGTGKPVGPPQVIPPSRLVYASTGEPARPAPVARPAGRPEEMVVRRVLEPLVGRRPGAHLPFVRCLDAGGWKQAGSDPAQQDQDDDDPLDVPARDPEQAVCRARLQARDRGVLVELLKDASGAYQGHLAATDVREHLDAYLGRWFESDIQVDTEDFYPVQDP